MGTIEQAFAARLFNAEREAAVSRKHGLSQTAEDFIAIAEAELWASGLPRDEIKKLVAKYKRPFDRTNVVTMR